MVSLNHERLLRHIDEHNNSYLAGWEQFYTHFNQAQQFKTASAAYDQLLPLLARRGFQTTRLTNDPMCIYSELDNGAARTLLFSNGLSTNNNWELLAIATRLLAIDLYREWAGNIPVNIKWLLHQSNTTNVSQQSSLRSIVEEHRHNLQANGCLCDEMCTTEENILLPLAEDTPLLFLGCKGLLSVELTAHTTTKPVLSHYGTIVPDAAWRLLWALTSLKNAREEIVIDGFYDAIAPVEDASLYNLPNTASTFAQQLGMQNLLLGLQGLQMHYAHLLTPTCTITFVTGGNETDEHPSRVPAQARAQVDFYLVPEQEPGTIFASLQHHLHERGFADIEVQLHHSCPFAYTALSHPFVQLVSNAITQTWEHAPLILPMTPENHPLAPLQQMTNMPILITPVGNASPQQWNHDTVISLLTKRLKQMALIILRSGDMS